MIRAWPAGVRIPGVGFHYDTRMSTFSKPLAALACAAGVACAQGTLPEITVTTDNTRIDKSCRVRIPEGTVITDADGNGVIHIVADGITVEFLGDHGAELVGAKDGTPWEELTGVGVRIDGRTGVTLRNAHTHNFKVGIWASNADGLTIDGADVADGFAMRLKSTPQAEDGSDWLWPHDNDEHEWMERYGAGIYVERSSGVTIKDCYARRRQNGIVIDRVTDSKVFDNDCSFLSGWGLAMWRSSKNIISRNAFDFCVRGYSHGVYNRGQDSAGILFFEQCSDNLLAENSATHGGDSFFGFGGKEALGQAKAPEGFSHERAGCNDNLLINNDFSYAPAHGIELTFSFGNRLVGNRLVENAICGVWGGYSQDTLIAGNLFETNGQMAYGLERGGVNIEHGAGNIIRDNVFRGDKCAVHLWWDNDEGLLETDWAKANHRGVVDNEIIRNRFEGTPIAIQLRDTGVNSVGGNEFEGVGKEIDRSGGEEPVEVMVTMELFQPPEYEALGETRPVGARSQLAGRQNIIMGEYFPWDHEGPLARRAKGDPGTHRYEVLGEVEDFYFVLNGATAQAVLREPGEDDDGKPTPLRVDVHGPAGVHPYVLKLRGKDFETEYADTLVVAKWKATFFPWTVDPRENLAGWRAQAKTAEARSAELDALNLPYGMGGPRDQDLPEAVTKAGPGPDRFGMIATSKLTLPAGRWRVSTLSDDGVRVMIDGKPVIENWTWHAPARDTAEFDQAATKLVEITVEHFEIDGFATLELQFEPVETE